MWEELYWYSKVYWFFRVIEMGLYQRWVDQVVLNHMGGVAHFVTRWPDVPLFIVEDGSMSTEHTVVILCSVTRTQLLAGLLGCFRIQNNITSSILPIHGWRNKIIYKMFFKSDCIIIIKTCFLQAYGCRVFII